MHLSPARGNFSRLIGVMTYLTAQCLRLLLYFIMRSNPTKDPVLSVSWYRRIGHLRVEVYDVGGIKVAGPETQPVPGDLQ